MWLRRIWSAIEQLRSIRPSTGPTSLGARGELAAERFVRRLGWIVIEGNTQTRFSELDLIAVDGRTVVFVEVKTRTSDDAEDALLAVDLPKQRRIARAALAFLKKNHLLEQSVRFDVIAVTWPDPSAKPTIHHIQSAFESPLRDSFF